MESDLFELTDEQQMFKEAIRRFCEKEVAHLVEEAEATGNFLCAIFDEWKSRDIEKIRVEMFEEVARSAFGQEAAVCIFRVRATYS